MNANFFKKDVKGIKAYTDAQKVTDHELINKYAILVKRIARHLIARLPPIIQEDDLVQSGMIGLLEAAKNYDKTKGASFETYAGIRIRGSMLDEIRRGDWAPRSVHRNTRLIAQAIKDIENLTGRDAKDHEVAAKLEISLERYHQMLQDSTGVRIFGFDEIGVNQEYFTKNILETKCEPHQKMEKIYLKNHLKTEVDNLPEKERLVLALYYQEELNLKEVGDVIGVSESRVSQIHSQAMLRLQSRLKNKLL